MPDTLARVQKAFHEALNVDPQLISIDTQPDDIPAWDSIGHVTLAVSLEREFNLSLDVDELMAMENVREIMQIVEARISRTS